MTTGWEDRADTWLAWARTPRHDAYWHYRDAFFELLPAPPARTLEIGCGEGRVSRDLRGGGYDVVGLDPAPTLIAAARAADPDGDYVEAAAEALPYDDGAFDLVVLYNSLMDVDDMPRAVAEAGRVVRTGGCVAACVTHPLNDAGDWDGAGDDAPFSIEGSYFERGWDELTFERDGLRFTFRSRRYALGDYAHACEDAGLVLTAVREPGHPTDRRRQRIPLFLHLVAVKT